MTFNDSDSEMDWQPDSETENKPERKSFDMNVLRSCIDGGSLALKQVEGKDVIVIAGKTGTGKTTLIQGIAGKVLYEARKEVVHEGHSLTLDVYEAENPLDGFTIGHSKESETKTISAYVRGEFVYIDSPGFEDTSGPEVDIASSAMFSKVVKMCKTLRFVILINYASLLEDRGGAFRAVLKFVREFSKDFEKQFKSFMFLFTHLDHIENSKSVLYNQIVQIHKGTYENDLRSMIGLIKFYLEKKKNMVDVFHPTKTNFDELIHCIEGKLVPLNTSQLATDCNMTLTSTLRLEAAIRSQHQLLCHLLDQENMHPDQIRNLLQTFCYVAHYIGKASIKREIDVAFNSFIDFASNCSVSLSRELTGATSNDHFSSEDAQLIKARLSKLIAVENCSSGLFQLSHTLNSSYFQVSIEEEVDGLHRVSSANMVSNFYIALCALSKMNSWSQAFPQFLSAFSSARQAILEYMNIANARLDCSTESMYSQEEISQVIGHLMNAKEILSTSKQFPNLSLDASCLVEKSLDQINTKLFALFSSWRNLSDELCIDMYEEEALETVIKKDFPTMRLCLHRLKEMKNIHNQLIDTNVLSDLIQHLISSILHLEEQAVILYKSMCTHSKKLELPLEDTRVIFHELKRISDECNVMQQRQLCLFEYNSLIEYAVASVKAKVDELEMLANTFPKSCGRDGHYCGTAIVEQKKLKWLDELFIIENLVATSCESFCEAVHAKADVTIHEISKILELLVAGSHGRNNLCRDLLELLPEYLYISEYTNVSGDQIVGLKLNKVLDLLTRYRSAVDTDFKKFEEIWATTMRRNYNEQNHLKTLRGIVSDLLFDLKLLHQFKILEDCSTKSLKITQMCEAFGCQIQEKMSTQGDYKRKAWQFFFLQLLRADSSFSHVSLPTLSTVKESFIKSIYEHAEMIKKKILYSNDFCEIENEIKLFEDALLLSTFISDIANRELQAIRTMQQHKETDIVSNVEDMLANNDFQGVCNLLEGFIHNQDLEKHNSCKKIIRFFWKDRIDAALSMLDTRSFTLDVATRLQESLLAIEKGKSVINIKTHFSEMDSLVAPILEKLKPTHNRMLNEFRKHMSTLNYFTIVDYREILTVFFEGSRSFLDKGQCKSHHMAMDACKRKLDYAPQSLRKVLNNFTTSSSMSDSLLKALDNLVQSLDRCDPQMENLALLYKTITTSLGIDLNKNLTEWDEFVSETNCFDQAIPFLSSLNKQLRMGLQKHIPMEHPLIFDTFQKVEDWDEARFNNKLSTSFDDKNANELLQEYALRLRKLQKTYDHEEGIMFHLRRWFKKEANDTSDSIKHDIKSFAQEQFLKGKSALENRDYNSLQNCIMMLQLTNEKIGEYVPDAKLYANSLAASTLNAFTQFTQEAITAYNSGTTTQVAIVFDEFRQFVLVLTCVMETDKGVEHYNLLNKLICDKLTRYVSELLDMLEMTSDLFTFSEIENTVNRVRAFGNFVADHYTLFHQDTKRLNIKEDESLNEITRLSCQYFSCGRVLNEIRYCSVLGVLPSASESEIRKAYKMKATMHHPDSRNAENCTLFPVVKEAEEKLLAALKMRDMNEKPFDSALKRVGEKLRRLVHQYLEEQRFELVAKILFNLSDAYVLENLIGSGFNSDQLQIAVEELVAGHLSGIKVSVDSLWTERKYKELNGKLEELFMMEKHLKSFPRVNSGSWNAGLRTEIEGEIDKLGIQANSLLKSEADARMYKSDFQRCFLQMGSIAMELPFYKNYTLLVMSQCLETSLKEAWGYSYVFELGLSLQQCDQLASADEARIAQLLLGEFNQFKEVLTMVWNEETLQKSVKDTVGEITAQKFSDFSSKHVHIDNAELLKSFLVFESEYKSLLGTFIKPEADLTKLVQITEDIVRKLAPLTCSNGWTDVVKVAIPKILAGIFALFTVIKSGASYNLISSSSTASALGEKLLMKPHNIQILTVLFMLGIGTRSSCLESKLAQVKTGEGKSMVLGAMTALLALLGFKVRCVCYSDFLSNRDYKLFEDVFQYFHLLEHIKYSKITSMSEEATAAKGDIRQLSRSLIFNETSARKRQSTQTSSFAGIGRRKITSLSQFPSSFDKRIEERDENDANEFPNSTDQRINGDEEHVASPYRVTRSMATKEAEKLSKHPQSVAESKKPIHSGTNNITTSYNYLLQDATDEHESVEGPFEESLCMNTPIPMNQVVAGREEILLVDEVDVFFGSDFYGQTYNQVVQLNEPEIAEILKEIWKSYKLGQKAMRLNDVKSMQAYIQLLTKMPDFGFLLDNEIKLMLAEVSLFDDEPYFLDTENDRIGYKVMDNISYDATYGYRTVFAYLKEADKGRLRKKDSTLQRVLTMPVSCAQFSYANISPARILGVSGTLASMGNFERDVLSKYGVNIFAELPSVYGSSNLQFDKAGSGVSIEASVTDYHLKISQDILSATKASRAVIVFFSTRATLSRFTSSAIYHKLGRQKVLLTEDMKNSEKEFVIMKAATCGQITICTSVFGRGTDFFCKDERVVRHGGVHIIQTFFSPEVSEEIQIQGRTARQGKRGTYQMVLLGTELEQEFGISHTDLEKVARQDLYEYLCHARDIKHQALCNDLNDTLQQANDKDIKSHLYFDALLAQDTQCATELLKDNYLAMKKSLPSSATIDLAFLIDVTGSMAPYLSSVVETIKNLLDGPSSILSMLKAQFEGVEWKIRVAILGYRDLDDKASQFSESKWGLSHFSDSIKDSVDFLDLVTQQAFGGNDIAEDVFGALHHCTHGWSDADDWIGDIKLIVVLTDAPAHGLVDPSSVHTAHDDFFATCHPLGLSPEIVVNSLITTGVDLFFCSFNPYATRSTTEKIEELFCSHPDNINNDREVTPISMVPHTSLTSRGFEYSKHIIFVLDESGSMQHRWRGVVDAYNKFRSKRILCQAYSDIVSVVQFDDTARITVEKCEVTNAPTDLSYNGRGTCFHGAAVLACQAIRDTPPTHAPIIIFMSDGEANDALQASCEFSAVSSLYELELHVIGFGSSFNKQQLELIAKSSKRGKLHKSADTAELIDLFAKIAGNQNVANIIEAKIGKLISETVSAKLSIEYMS